MFPKQSKAGEHDASVRFALSRFSKSHLNKIINLGFPPHTWTCSGQQSMSTGRAECHRQL